MSIDNEEKLEKITKIILVVVTIIVGFILIFSDHYDENNTYYFIYNNVEYKADRQQFLVSITGEVLNCYFYIKNTEYTTCNYRKETIKTKWNVLDSYNRYIKENKK